ncbi:hypothetical protein AKJ09_04366 [Labilithrix luteola]|uniref:Quinol:cytochrome C oxidoreductase n=1 Tax=Labilithrix luteola TaxID=1391654 RepID=A0A0K1PW14_9BACT|nr:hypothetical protein [Labilithrix luteola]AKU97702.1 hypothetical protein AKJ09_04366 [Labilithrix luteola]
MSASKKDSSEKHTWELTGSWAGAWKIFAGIGVLGLIGAGLGYTQDARRFAFSWMFAFITVLTIALGALFFVLIQRLTSAGWSVTVRRTAEFFAYGVVIMIPLFLPVLGTMNQLFPWLGSHDAHGEHGGEHAAPHKGEEHGSIPFVTPAYAQEHAPAPAQGGPAGDHAAPPPGAMPHGGPAGMGPHGMPGAMPGFGHGGMGPMGAGAHGGHGGPVAAGLPDPHALEHKELMEKKAGYLNRNAFLIRAVVYFVIWAFLALRLFGYSAAQDRSKDPKLTLKAQSFAPGATMLFALSVTFAAFDWVMSLEPTWFSTIFGVYVFAGGVVSSYAVMILVTMALRNAGPLSGAVTVEHYHDLGKLMFGFLVFWAYIGFSQFMLIWYAALPEETTFFHNRWDHTPWARVSLVLIVVHFVVPFFWLISRNFKRNLGRLQLGAALLLVMHVVDIYWLVMPNYLLNKPGFSFHWMDAACLLAVGGIYGAFVFFRMTKYPLVPVGDPRLQRSLHFQNA